MRDIVWCGDSEALFINQTGEIHYISGTDVLPVPLEGEEEKNAIAMLATEAEREHGRNILIEHNLRLVVYIARKFDNTGAGMEDLISIGTIGLIKAINSYNPDKILSWPLMRQDVLKMRF